MILTPLLKLPKNGEDWGKLIVAKGFKKLPKIQNIAQSGHTGWEVVVAQLVERSLPIPEVRGLKPVIGKILLILNICKLSTVC